MKKGFVYVGETTPIEKHKIVGVGTVWLKRDDLFMAAGAPGGKARTCFALAKGAKGLIAASHRHSPQMSMVARMAHHFKIPCRIHTATGPGTPQIDDATGFGAEIVRHTPGYNGVIIARARADAAARPDWCEIPFGMESQEAVDLTSQQVKNIPKEVERIVMAIGIGVSMAGVLHGLDRERRNIPILAVKVGAPKPERYIRKWAPEGWEGRVEIIKAAEDYSTHVSAEVGGVVLDPVYEAKVFKHLRNRDLLWVVGIRASSLSRETNQ